MSEIFGGALLSQVKCLSCKGESNKTDEIMDISLDIYQCSSLKNALARFFQAEVLDGNNKYSCGKCNKMVVAKKQIFMLRPPNVLVIQLKRFEGSGKINRNIEFEEILVLSKFMYKASQESQSEYNLFGSIVHSGFSPESGHYYAYIKDALGRWYCCNDAYVSLSSSQEVLSEKVYILFYMRNNQYSRPSNLNDPIKTNSPSNGLKASNSNGNGVSPCEKSRQFFKQSPVKLNGAFSSKVNGAAMIRNGKISPSQQIKPINTRNLGLKRVIENGKGNLEAQSDASVEKSSINIGQLKEHKESPEYSLMDESKMVDGVHVYPAANGNTANGNASSDLEERYKKQNVSVSNGNESDDLLQAKFLDGDDNEHAATVKIDPVCEQSSDCIIGNGFGPTSLLKVGSEDDDKQVVTAVKREPDRDHSSNNLINKYDSTSASKRKSCDAERGEVQDLCFTESSSSLSITDASCTKNTNKRKHPSELEIFKEQLARNAYSHLRSGDWADTVHNFMRNRKRICTQNSGVRLDNDELRKQLITDARKALASQIPLSLKADLIGALLSFFEGKYISDA